MRQDWFKVLVAATAAAFSMGSHAQGSGAILIGVNQPLTGAVAASGNFVTNGARIAADEINAKGGIGGNRIQLVIEDNKSNPTEAANVAEKLIVRDKVKVMLGAWSSTYTLAVMPKLMEYKVPMVVETSGADKITTSGNPYIFRICPTNVMEAEAFSRHVAPLKIRKADMLVVNNDWGRGSADAFQAMLKGKGVDVGRVLTMDATAQDMTSQLSSLKGSDSDTLFVTTAVEQLVLVLKQIQSLGLKRQVITLGGSQSPDLLISHAGSAANGTMHNMMFAPWFPEASGDPDAAKSFIGEWNKRRYDAAGLTEGFRGYDGIRTIAAAVAKAGKVDPEAIRQALWDVQLNGLTGKIAFKKVGPKDKESGQSSPNTYLVRVESGKVALVGP
jgi:branched-chain amino acid transport system substrate-binding protein